MELISFDDTPCKVSSKDNNEGARCIKTNNMYRYLRRYLRILTKETNLKRLVWASIALSLSLIILSLGMHFSRSPCKSRVPFKPQAPLSSYSKYRVYTNGDTVRRFLLETAPDCDQRKHDLKYSSVICDSNNTANCKLPEENLDSWADGGIQIITTSRLGKRLESRFVMLRNLAIRDECRVGHDCDTDSRTKIYIRRGRKQKIIGWGGALTDSSINNIMSLTTNGTISLLSDYFGPNGLRFNLIRITIGGSDFSSRFYTNNDYHESRGEDSTSFFFQLRAEDYLYKIPVLRYLQGRFDGIKLFASMWSPPTWMKTNNHFNKGQLQGSISPPSADGSAGSNEYNEEEAVFRELADLKRDFIIAYQESHVKFWGLTVMNEPVFAMQPFLDFNTMIFPREDYANYIAKYLGPAIKNDSRLSHIKLMAHDDNRRYLMNFTEPTLNTFSSSRYIDGVSVHGYADTDYYQMETIYLLHRDKNLFVLPTELCSGHLPWMQKALAGNWHRGVHYALDIIKSLQHSAAGWVDWNMALDMEGGPGWLGGRLDSPILVDKAKDRYHKSPMFYVMGQFSRYIPPGSVRMDTSLINGIYNYPLETVTFIAEEKTVVTVVLNANPHVITIYLQMHESDKFIEVACEAESVTTIRYPEKLKIKLTDPD